MMAGGVDVATLGVNIQSDSVPIAGQRLDAFSATADRVSNSLKAFLEVAGVALGFRQLIAAVSESEATFAQLEARLRSTGGTVGYTANQLLTMAKGFQSVTAFSDEAVQKAQAVLLTYTNIGNNVFPLATKATLDMAAAMGGDASSSAYQLGKALADPEHGLMMLRRAGIVLDEALVQHIKIMFANNQVEAAQILILQEIEKRVGGAAEAYRNTLGGALASVANAFDDFLERIGETGLSSALREATLRLREFIQANDDLSVTLGSLAGEGIRRVIEGLVWLVEHWEQVRKVLEVIIAIKVASWFLGIVTALGAVSTAGAFLGPWAILIAAVGAEVALVAMHWGEVKTKIEELVNYIRNNPIAQFFAPLMEVPNMAATAAQTNAQAAINRLRASVPLIGKPLATHAELPLFPTQVESDQAMDASKKMVAQMSTELAILQQRNELLANTTATEREWALASSEAGRAISRQEAILKAISSLDPTTPNAIRDAIGDLAGKMFDAKTAQADFLEGGKFMAQFQTPWEKFNRELQRASELFQTGVIDLGQYRMALAKLNEEATHTERVQLGKIAGDVTAAIAANRFALSPGGTTGNVEQMRNLNTQLAIEQGLRERNVDAVSEEGKMLAYVIRVQQEGNAVLEDTARANQIIAETRKPGEIYAQQQEELNRLLKEGYIDVETYNRGLEKAYDTMLGVSSETERMQKAFEDAGDVMSSAFTKALVDGEDLRDIVDGLTKDLQRILIRTTVTEPLQKWFKGMIASFFTPGATPGSTVPKELMGTSEENAMWVRFAGGGKPGVPFPNADELFSGWSSLLQGGSGNETTGILEALQLQGGVFTDFSDAMSTGSTDAANKIASAFTSQNGGGGFLAGLINSFSGLLGNLGGLFSSFGSGLMNILGSMGSGIMSGLGSIGGGFMDILGWIGGLFMEQGGVFDTAGLTSFAGGGVVRRPTFFPMRNGRMGIFGESGIEGIFPLHRGPSGDLGVRAFGGGSGEGGRVQINIHNYSGADVKKKERRIPGGRQVDVIVGEMMATDIRRGGPLWQSLEQQAGLKRKGAGR